MRSAHPPISAQKLTSLDKLTGLLDPKILNQAYKEAGVATIRRQKLLLNAVMWSIIGMSISRKNLYGLLLANKALRSHVK